LRIYCQGHYGKVRQHTNGRYTIAKGVDETKDQSYVLWGLQQDLLARTLLPLGPYRKTEIRQMALDYGYPDLGKKRAKVMRSVFVRTTTTGLPEAEGRGPGRKGERREFCKQGRTDIGSA